MSFSTRLGSAFGIGIYLHWSFILLPLFVVYSSWSAGNSLITIGASLLLTLLLFACIVLHELGHALMARRFKIHTHDIVIWPIGGVARLARMPTKPIQELLIAIAGPLVNVAIAVVIFGTLLAATSPAALASPGLSGVSFFVTLAWANVLLVVFNMLPAFPMDGGRVLRSILAMMIEYETATVIAARIGQGMAILFGLASFYFDAIGLIFIAVFVFLAAGSEIRRVSRQRQYEQAAYRNLPVEAFRMSGANEIPLQSDERTHSVRLPDGRVVIVRTVPPPERPS